MLKTIAQDLWAVQAPEHTMLGLRLGTRMTVVRLKGGGVLLHSPVRYTPELDAEVKAIGEVRNIVCPNVYHHLYAVEWAKAHPNALVFGPPELAKKRPDVKFSGTLDPHPDWADTLVPIPISGCDLKETVFMHPRSRTVISSDLTENISSMDHFFTRTYLKMNGTYQKIGWPRVLRMLYRDKKAARESLAKLYEHDFDRVIVAHGDVIESGGKDAVRQTFAFLD